MRESWCPQESSWVTPPSIDDKLESPVEKFLAVLQLFTENLPYQSGRKGFTATQMVAPLSGHGPYRRFPCFQDANTRAYCRADLSVDQSI